MPLFNKDAALALFTPRRVLWVLLLLICNQLAQLSWHIGLPVNLPHHSVSASVGKATHAAKPEASAASFTLFGQAGPTPPAGADDAQNLQRAPISSLNVKLTGIVASPTPALSIAIIAQGNRQLSYAIGDTLPGHDARIAAIFADRVVIRYQERYEALPLFDAAPAAAINVGKPLIQLKEELQQQPQNLLNYLTIAPVMVDNHVTGYRLNPGKDRTLFQRVGLQPNDLAVALNGLDLRDAQQAQQALQQLPELSALNLTVERNGQLHDIYFALGDD